MDTKCFGKQTCISYKAFWETNLYFLQSVLGNEPVFTTKTGFYNKFLEIKSKEWPRKYLIGRDDHQNTEVAPPADTRSKLSVNKTFL